MCICVCFFMYIYIYIQAASLEFWRQQHLKNSQKGGVQTGGKALCRRWTLHMKQDHKVLRCFYQKYDALSDDPAALLTGSQKGTVVCFTLLADMLVNAALYDPRQSEFYTSAGK